VQVDSSGNTVGSGISLRIGNVTLDVQPGFSQQVLVEVCVLNELMQIGHPRQKVYLAVGATDPRKSIDGLAAIVQLNFELNPFDPCLFVFCNRRKDKVKVLEWSERGFWLHSFRLEKGRLAWPDMGDEDNPLTITGRIYIGA